MTKEEQNIYKNLFEYPTKKIAQLEIENINLQQRIDKALKVAYQYAQIDGDHHKMWVIDQMIRELLNDKYDEFIKEYEKDGEYTWDKGINP